jgi:hypothetical protein
MRWTAQQTLGMTLCEFYTTLQGFIDSRKKPEETAEDHIPTNEEFLAEYGRMQAGRDTRH